MRIKIKLSRPHLRARVDPPCAVCANRHGLVYDAERDVALPCTACNETAEVARQVSRARLPTSAFGAVVSGGQLAPPDIAVLAKANWRIAFGWVEDACTTAKEVRAAMSGGPDLSSVPQTLFVVWGGPSSGKTWMLANAVLSAAIQGLNPLYIAGADPFTTLRSLGAGDIGAGIADAIAAEILYIDDLGGQRHEKARGVLTDILKARQSEMRPTVIAVGVSEGQLTTEFGAAVARRMAKASRHLTEVAS